MEANELRLNNWIEWLPYEAWKKEAEEVGYILDRSNTTGRVQVKDITTSKSGVSCVNGFFLNSFGGIELSEEILVKAGAHHDLTDDIYMLVIEDSEFVQKRLEIAFIDHALIGNRIHVSLIQEFKIGNTEPTGVKIDVIEYLHQFQNLVHSISGTELTLNF
jgi:hypothetical protein